MNDLNTPRTPEDLFDAAIAQIRLVADDPDAPQGWDQDFWRVASVDGDRCKTTMCLAGWICELAGGEWASTPEQVAAGDDGQALVATPDEIAAGLAFSRGGTGRLKDQKLVHAADRATRLLDVPYSLAARLFFDPIVTADELEEKGRLTLAQARAAAARA